LSIKANGHGNLEAKSQRSDEKAVSFVFGPASSRGHFFKKGSSPMTKSIETIVEAVRNPKCPFRKVDSRPKKSQKHRYERRKIREYLHLGELLMEEETS
jgi:hypothetical protein